MAAGAAAPALVHQAVVAGEVEAGEAEDLVVVGAEAAEGAVGAAVVEEGAAEEAAAAAGRAVVALWTR